MTARMPESHVIEVRVRYTECDPMGVAHHSAFLPWLEMARTEMCRATGVSYRELEAEGALLAVTAIEVKYRAPARYDDLLRVETIIERRTRVKIEHAYRILRDGLLLATARSTIACIGRNGRPRVLPDCLLEPDD